MKGPHIGQRHPIFAQMHIACLRRSAIKSARLGVDAHETNRPISILVAVNPLAFNHQLTLRGSVIENTN